MGLEQPINEESFKELSLSELEKQYSDGETIKVLCEETEHLSLSKVEQWICKTENEIIAKGGFKNGVEGMKFWKDAIPKYDYRMSQSDRNRLKFRIYNDLSSGSPNPLIRIKVHRFIVYLTNGEQIRNILYVTITNESSPPKKRFLIKT